MSSITFNLMFADGSGGVGARADYDADVLAVDLPGGTVKFSLSHILHCLAKPYHIVEPSGGWKKTFADVEKKKLRPMAETLAMLDGNAFFGNSAGGSEWYESYLPEASAVYDSNGGDDGWAGAASFAADTLREG